MTAARVLFVSHTGSISGAEMVMLDILPSCASASVFLFEDGPINARLQDCGVNVIASRFGAGFSAIKRDSKLKKALPLAGRMAAVIAELAFVARQYDAVYANSQKAFVLAAFAAAAARRPLIWHLHDIISDAHFGSGQRLLQSGLANRFARLVIAPSQAARSAFVEAGGRPNIVRVVPNGIDSADGGVSPLEIRQELGLSSGPLLGVFSRLSPWKGQHIVLQALADLPDVQCIFAGSALFGEHEYERSLHTLAGELDLANRAKFLGQRHDVPSLMRSCDAVIHPSVDPEPFGRTLVEAMLAGTPVIATDTGASAEILAGGEAGMLVPPGDAKALAAAVRHAMANPAELLRQTKKARRRAHKVYGAAKMRSTIANVIGEATRRAVH